MAYVVKRHYKAILLAGFYLIDSSIISFDEESLLNALLDGSDKLNDKINK